MIVALVVAACTGDGDDAEPAPTTIGRTSTTVVDRSGIALAAVAGSTTTSIVETGTTTITGTVHGPAGLVPGATVVVERLVAGREVRHEVVTGPDGRFGLGSLPGGRYRIRAYLAPSLAQLEPVVRFLADGDEHAFDLAVEPQEGIVVRADVAPEPPVLGQPVNLVAVVASRRVDPDGIVRAVPVTGVTVELVGTGRWRLLPTGSGTTTGRSGSTSTTPGPPSAFARTDSSGRVRSELQCEEPGPPGLALRVPIRSAPAPVTATTLVPTTQPPVTPTSFPLDLPGCVDPQAATTAATTTTAGSG